MYEDTYFLDPDCRSQPNSLPPGLGTAFQFLPDPTLTYDLESSDDPLLYDLDDDRGEKNKPRATVPRSRCLIDEAGVIDS